MNYGIAMFEQHQQLLRDSGISVEVARARNYQSVDTAARLESIDISPGFRKIPGLLIPVYGAYANPPEASTWQYRPDHPPVGEDGKPMKYATAQRPVTIDIPPAVRPHIGDPTRPLWITEGVRKADSAVSHGIDCIDLLGVDMWRARNKMGGIVALADWNEIALNDREVYICFDSDVMAKASVHKALVKLAGFLKAKQAIVRLVILPDIGAGKTGLDDYLASGGTVQEIHDAGRVIWPEELPKPAKPTTDPETAGTFTDAGLVEVLGRDVYGENLIWVDRLGWHRFDGMVWRETSETSVNEDVRVWSMGQYRDCVAKSKEEIDPVKKEKLLNLAEQWRDILDARRRSQVIRDSRGHVERSHKQLDADPGALNTQSGLLALDTGLVRPTEPDDLVTKVAGADINPTACSERWEGFLTEILPDPDVRDFLARLVGQAMYGAVTEHILTIFTGTGANGKSVTRDVLMAAFGDYATEVDPELLMESHNVRHGTFKMQLRGRRLVFTSETDEGRRFANATMKRLTGGDPIEANLMRKDPIVFKPSHTLVMVTNHLPHLPGDDDASWRRVRVVPFDVVIPEEKRDPKLSEKLTQPDVLAAVLAWAYRGFLQYQLLGGLQAPDAVRVRTAEYRAENDPLGRFVKERTFDGGKVDAASLYKAYERFCANEGEIALNKTAFGKAMARLGHESAKIGGLRMYRTIGLLADEEDSRYAA